jgi:hypothetical protein
MIPENSHESAGFRKFIDKLPKEINDTKIVVHRRPNQGMSYGSWSDAFATYGQQFKYYFFIEDDYLPCRDYYDDILIELFEEAPNCGYVAQYTIPHFAPISNGLASSAALFKVFKKRKQLPHSPSPSNYPANERGGQIAFTHAIVEEGYKLYDICDIFLSPFLNARNQVVYFGNQNAKPLIAPIQYLLKGQYY